jgi:hypothetical protein
LILKIFAVATAGLIELTMNYMMCLQMPYYVVADHKTGSIVLVIRGSISMRDVFTDLNAGAEKFEAEGLPANSMVGNML